MNKPLKSSLQSGTSVEDVAAFCELLKVLSNPNRLLILRLLLDGERAVGDIEQTTGVRQPTLSRELATLRRNDLVQTRRHSRVIYYSLPSNENETDLVNVLALVDPSLLNRSDNREPAGETGARPGECARFAVVKAKTYSGYSA